MLDVVFPVSVSGMMPPYESVPQEFKRGTTKWNTLFSEWFYAGLKSLVLTPKPGIDRGEALGVIKAVMGSFEPKHEHKEAAVAYLLSLWFEDASWERGVEKP